MLGGVADEAQRTARGLCGVAQCVEVVVGQSGGLVDDEHGVGVQSQFAAANLAEPLRDGLGVDASLLTEQARGLALHGGTDDSEPCGGPDSGGCRACMGLAGAGPSDRGLDPMTRSAPGAHHVFLLVGEFSVALSVLAQRLIDARLGDAGGLSVQALLEGGLYLALNLDAATCGELLLWSASDRPALCGSGGGSIIQKRDHLLRAQEVGGDVFEHLRGQQPHRSLPGGDPAKGSRHHVGLREH